MTSTQETMPSFDDLLTEISSLPFTGLRLSAPLPDRETPISTEEFFSRILDEWRTEQSSFFHSLVTSPTTAPLLAWLASGNDVNTRDAADRTLLHYAIRHSASPEMVTALLSHGADPTLRDSNDMTPLMWAAEINSPASILTALLSAGADVNAHDSDGWTPLMLAANSRAPKTATIKTFLNAGAELTPAIFDILAADPESPDPLDIDCSICISNVPRPAPQSTCDDNRLIDPIEPNYEPQPTEPNAEPNAPSDSDESQLPTAESEPESALSSAPSSCAMTAPSGAQNENDNLSSLDIRRTGGTSAATVMDDQERPEGKVCPDPASGGQSTEQSAEDFLAPDIFKDFPKPITDVVFPCTTATTVSQRPSTAVPRSNPVPSSVSAPTNHGRSGNKGRLLYPVTLLEASTPCAPNPKKPRFPAPKPRRWQTDGAPILLSEEALFYLVRNRLDPHTSHRANPPKKRRNPLDPFPFIVAGTTIMFVFLTFVVLAYT